MSGHLTWVQTSLIYLVKDLLHESGYPTEADLVQVTGVPFYVEVTRDKGYLSQMHLPAVAVFPTFQSHGGMVQLGGGRYVRDSFTIDIYAQRQTQRLDLADILFQGLYRDSTLYTYEGGRYPVYTIVNGSIEKTYPTGQPTAVTSIEFEDLMCDFPNDFPVNDGDAYRAQIRVTAVYER